MPAVGTTACRSRNSYDHSYRYIITVNIITTTIVANYGPISKLPTTISG